MSNHLSPFHPSSLFSCTPQPSHTPSLVILVQSFQNIISSQLLRRHMTYFGSFTAVKIKTWNSTLYFCNLPSLFKRLSGYLHKPDVYILFKFSPFQAYQSNILNNITDLIFSTVSQEPQDYLLILTFKKIH